LAVAFPELKLEPVGIEFASDFGRTFDSEVVVIQETTWWMKAVVVMRCRFAKSNLSGNRRSMFSLHGQTSILRA
jgi:hypothetical protein